MKRKIKHLLSSAAVIAFISIAVASGDSKKSDSTASTTDSSASTDNSKPKQWTQVFTIKGNGMKKSASFALGGGKTKVKYDYKDNSGAGVFSFYVVPEGEDVMKTGGIPEVMIQQSESSETYITKDPGNYYLNISSTGNWTITVEEEK
ncbi:hypothetical protein [Ferruginibacter albus]|uniref:hypothetical protein n=1 Tax=Ferruginibacter albus TaxID=2875540 RepID=UPI001CC55AD1|nr:hypothetical protein [Ferruginibacter albus]UAY52764.1 hypothetical protein K9M53_03530 [Ferruginibacter albus]